MLETNFNPTTNYLPKLRYADFKAHERNRIARKKILEARIAHEQDYLNELLSVILNDGMLDTEVLKAVLNHGGDEFIGTVIKPREHKRSFKVQKQLLKSYKRS